MMTAIINLLFLVSTLGSHDAAVKTVLFCLLSAMALLVIGAFSTIVYEIWTGMF